MTAELLLGALVGILLGLLGGGGSILAVPALLFGVGVPLSNAIPTSLIVVAISSGTALIPRLRSGQVQWRTAAVFGGAGGFAAFGGAAVNRFIDPAVLLLGFATLMIAVAIRMLCELPGSARNRVVRADGISWRVPLSKTILVGTGVGFLTGLFGVGGGFLIIPALVVLLGLPMTVATGTSLLIIVINSAAGYAAYAGQVDLDYTVTASFTASAVIGSLGAACLATRLEAARLRRWFAYLTFAVAVFVVMQVLMGRTTI